MWVKETDFRSVPRMKWMQAIHRLFPLCSGEHTCNLKHLSLCFYDESTLQYQQSTQMVNVGTQYVWLIYCKRKKAQFFGWKAKYIFYTFLLRLDKVIFLEKPVAKYPTAHNPTSCFHICKGMSFISTTNTLLWNVRWRLL